jgi:NarL family two-component system sensor histidine kinase LiaS
MLTRIWRSSKWELILIVFGTSLISTAIAAVGTIYAEAVLPPGEWRSAAAAAFVLVNIAIGYWAAQRNQRRIDALHFAIKQAVSGNLAVRIPEEGARSFAPVYRDFNEMAAKLEERLQLLQRMGEEQVMREAASNEAAVLEERKRLARDLHDTVSQQLFAIHVSASSLPKLLEINRERAAEVMRQLIQMSTSAQRQMRGLIAQLRPLELEGRSLREALEKWFPDYCRQNGLQGELRWDIDSPLSDAKEHQLFLIIQEAMANIVKHAAAQRVLLHATETERQYAITLQDDGAGFRADQVKAGSYGLTTMRERAQKLGGDTEIISKTGAGTRIRVTIPKYGSEERDTDERDG